MRGSKSFAFCARHFSCRFSFVWS